MADAESEALNDVRLTERRGKWNVRQACHCPGRGGVQADRQMDTSVPALSLL